MNLECELLHTVSILKNQKNQKHGTVFKFIHPFTDWRPQLLIATLANRFSKVRFII